MSKSVKSDTSKSIKGEPITGRPSLYKPEYCEMLISHMEKGFSFRSFAGIVRVNFDTVYEWEKVHPAFSDAKKTGEALQLVYDERLLDQLSKGE